MKLKPETMRLYAVTERRWLRGRTLAEQAEEALQGGVTLMQLREKELEEEAFLREALELTCLCHRHGVPLLINDRVDIALRCGADGVHLGQGDMDPAEARRLLGPEAIIGVTAKTPDQARAAEAAGADYLGSGAVFGSATKLNALPMTRETLMSVCRSVSLPVVAIGGINRDNILRLSGTGIDGVAVVSGIFATENIREECRLLRRLADEITAEPIVPV